MKENVDKYLDDLAKKVIKDASIESPSFNFTESIMSQVEVINNVSRTIYKPLISKKVWLLITLTFICAIVFLIDGTTTTTGSWLSNLDLSIVTNNKITNSFSGFSMSKTLSYSIGFLALMICIQVTFLKHHFNKRFEV